MDKISGFFLVPYLFFLMDNLYGVLYYQTKETHVVLHLSPMFFFFFFHSYYANVLKVY